MGRIHCKTIGREENVTTAYPKPDANFSASFIDILSSETLSPAPSISYHLPFHHHPAYFLGYPAHGLGKVDNNTLDTSAGDVDGSTVACCMRLAKVLVEEGQA